MNRNRIITECQMCHKDFDIIWKPRKIQIEGEEYAVCRECANKIEIRRKNEKVD